MSLAKTKEELINDLLDFLAKQSKFTADCEVCQTPMVCVKVDFFVADGKKRTISLPVCLTCNPITRQVQ